jgi:hypothetical protein
MSNRIDNAQSLRTSTDAELTIPVELSTGPPRSFSRLFSYARGEWIAVIAAFGLISLLWYVMGDVVRDSNNLAGTDTYWHTTLIDEAVDRFNRGDSVGPISESINAGTPYLYDTGSVYPEFSYWTAIVLALVVGSSSLAFAILMFSAVLLSQLTFYFGFRSRFGSMGAAVGAIAYGYGPFFLTNVGVQGRLPAVLAVSLLPLILAAVLNTLNHPTKKWWIAGLFATMLSVSFHPMVFYMAAVGMAIISVLVVITARVSFKRIVIATALIVLGVSVSWIFLPDQLTSLSFTNGAVGALGGADGAGMRASTGAESKIVPFSIRWNSFDVTLKEINENYAGIGLALAGLLAPVLVWRRNVVLFTLAAMALYLLATGTLTPFWNMIPLASALEPRRFLFPANLVLALAIAAAINALIARLRWNLSKTVMIRSSLGIVVILALLAFDIVPMSERLSPESRGVERSWIEPATNTAEGGRLFWNAIKDFAPYYFVGRELELETMGRLGDVDLAVRQGFTETAIERLALLDTRAVLTDEAGFPPLVQQLVQAGFTERYRQGTQTLLTSDRPSTRIMTQSRKVGLVGAAATLYWSRIIPNSVSIHSIESNPPEFINSFDVLVVSGLSTPNGPHVESVLSRYVEAGGLVVIGEPNRLGDDWFGEEGEERPVPEVLTIESNGETFQTQRFAFGQDRYVGTFYPDAGATVLNGTDEEGNDVPIIQKRLQGAGAIYWVCCHIGNHTVVNPGQDFSLAYSLRSYFENEIGGYGDTWPKSFGGEVEFTSRSEFRFEYESDVPEVVVISSRDQRQRKVMLDGKKELEIVNFGNVLSVFVPAGKHEVLVTAEGTPLKMGSLVIWIMAVIAAIYFLYKLWGRLSAPTPTSGGVLPTIKRWIVEPQFAKTFEMEQGLLKVCEPRTGRRFDVKTSDGTYRRIEPLDNRSSIAAVLVEISASLQNPLEVDLSQMQLVDSGGAKFSMITLDELGSWEVRFPNLIYLLDTKNPLLEKIISLKPVTRIRGYVIFEFATEEEYPFVHNGFASFSR